MSFAGQLSPVLLVDDNADDLFVLRARLMRGGVENPIESFEAGEEAMAYMKRLMEGAGPLPCTVFLDLRMPRCGGFEVLKWIKSHEALSGVRVVIVSTSNLAEDAKRATQLGAERFLAKYPAPETLAQIVKTSTGGGTK